MVSRTRMDELVRGHRWAEVKAGIEANPALLAVRQGKGANWLHICCRVKPKGTIEDSIRTADVLLEHYGIDDPSFTEGEWKATPVWHCTANSNTALARHLLERGASPHHSLFAACYNNDLEMIRLLIAHGAMLEEVTEQATPVLDAVKFSRFLGAEALLKAGANPDWVDPKGRTSLHIMLSKGTPPEHFEMFVAAGARGDIPDKDGKTAIDILKRKRDPLWHSIADRLATA
jgi:uncharacterized protein